jgi:phosphorylcholine metabolism protein LicD
MAIFRRHKKKKEKLQRNQSIYNNLQYKTPKKLIPSEEDQKELFKEIMQNVFEQVSQWTKFHPYQLRMQNKIMQEFPCFQLQINDYACEVLHWGYRRQAGEKLTDELEKLLKKVKEDLGQRNSRCKFFLQYNLGESPREVELLKKVENISPEAKLAILLLKRE